MMGELIFWGIVFVAALIAELASFQLVSIWFAVGAAGAFAASMMHMGFAAQLGIFAAVSAALLLVTRPLLKRLRVDQQLRTNADLNIGEKAVVIEEVDAAHGTGRVRADNILQYFRKKHFTNRRTISNSTRNRIYNYSKFQNS